MADKQSKVMIVKWQRDLKERLDTHHSLVVTNLEVENQDGPRDVLFDWDCQKRSEECIKPAPYNHPWYSFTESDYAEDKSGTVVYEDKGSTQRTYDNINQAIKGYTPQGPHTKSHPTCDHVAIEIARLLTMFPSGTNVEALKVEGRKFHQGKSYFGS